MLHEVQLKEVLDRPAMQSRLRVTATRHRWFLLLVVVPSIVATIYYSLIASSMYVSESRFVIKSPDSKPAQITSLANLISTTGLSAGQEQANEVMDYLRSRDALKGLSRRMNVRSSFMSADVDRLSRFPAPFHDASFENFYKYYGNMVATQLDHDTGTVVLTVKAFSASDAYKLNENLLELGEGLVNQLNNRANRQGIEEAQRRVELAQARVRDARIALSRYRNASELLDPEQQGIGVLGVSNGLVAQRARLQAQLAATAQAAPANPSILPLRQRIAAISTQIDAQNARAVGSASGIASKLGGYEALAVEQEFATQMLKAASASLEQARVEAQKQQFYLERVVEPNRPDKALLPARLKQILTIFGALLCLYLVGWMLIAGILEHAPEDR
jgi:capsular polysaccharide transport system permease protein